MVSDVRARLRSAVAAHGCRVRWTASRCGGHPSLGERRRELSVSFLLPNSEKARKTRPLGNLVRKEGFEPHEPLAR